MNIAALAGSLLWPQATLASSIITDLFGGKSVSPAQATPAGGNVSGKSATADDSFRSSLSAAMRMNGTPNAGVQAGAQNPDANSGKIRTDIGVFLHKVADGTATSSDVKTMQNQLQQVQQAYAAQALFVSGNPS